MLVYCSLQCRFYRCFAVNRTQLATISFASSTVGPPPVGQPPRTSLTTRWTVFTSSVTSPRLVYTREADRLTVHGPEQDQSDSQHRQRSAPDRLANPAPRGTISSSHRSSEEGAPGMEEQQQQSSGHGGDQTSRRLQDHRRSLRNLAIILIAFLCTTKSVA